MKAKKSEGDRIGDLGTIAEKNRIHQELSIWLERNHSRLFSQAPKGTHYATVVPHKGSGQEIDVVFFSDKGKLFKHLKLHEISAYVSRYYHELELMY